MELVVDPGLLMWEATHQTHKDEAAGEAPEMTMRITWMIWVIVQEK